MGTGTLVHSLGSMNLSPMIRLDIASFFLCLIANGRMIFLFQQSPCFIYHRHNPLHLYAYIRCATYARDGRGLMDHSGSWGQVHWFTL